MKLLIKNFNIYITINNDIENSGYMNQLLTTFIHRYINVSMYEHLYRKCGFCGGVCKKNIRYNYEIINDELTIKSVNYNHDKDGYLFYYCFEKTCIGKKLNPNSIEFISKSRNLNYEDAMSYLKKRNKSPFYKENYDNIEDYTNYQKHTDFSDAKKVSIREKLKKVSSKDYIIQKHGLDYYNDLCKRKDSSSLYGFIKRYGKELGTIKFNEKNEKSILTLQKCIDKHGQSLGVYKYAYIQYYRNRDKLLSYDNMIKFYIKDINKECYLKKKTLTVNRVISLIRDLDKEVIKHYFKKDILDFCGIIFDYFNRKYQCDANYIYLFNNSKFRSYTKITENGYLRSRGEIILYDNVIKFISANDITLNKNYENSNYKSDMFISNIGHIEIMGMCNDLEYVRKMKLKKSLFNPILIESNEIYILQFVNDLKNNTIKKYYGDKYNDYFI